MKSIKAYNVSSIALLVLTTIVCVFALPGLTAAQTINLTYASFYAPTHPMGAAAQAWINKIEKETNGRVHIKPYWSESLISSKEAYFELMKGTADIGHNQASYTPSGFDIGRIIDTFFYGCTSQEMSYRVGLEVAAKFPQINAEFGDAKVLGWGATPPYHLLTAKRAVKTLGEFKGLQLKSLAAFMNPLKELGAVPINIPMMDTYIALQKGTVDGLMGPFEVLKTFKLAEVIKHVTILNVSRGHLSEAYLMNPSSWKRLPPDIQRVFEDNRDFLVKSRDDNLAKKDEEGVAYSKDLGTKFYELSAQDLKKFYELMDVEARKSAKALDNKGLPWTQILEEIRRLIEKYSKQGSLAK